MANGNGKSTTVIIAIASLIAGMLIGVMGNMVSASDNYVSKEDYREDVRRLERSIESLSLDVKGLRRDLAN